MIKVCRICHSLLVKAEKIMQDLISGIVLVLKDKLIATHFS